MNGYMIHSYRPTASDDTLSFTDIPKNCPTLSLFYRVSVLHSIHTREYTAFIISLENTDTVWYKLRDVSMSKTIVMLMPFTPNKHQINNTAAFHPAAVYRHRKGHFPLYFISCDYLYINFLLIMS